MILELGGGRELKLPDEMSDETARQLGKLIVGLEQRAKDAEDRAEDLARQFAELANRPALEYPKHDNSDVVAAVRELVPLLKQVIAVESADRIIVHDETGSPRSRIAK